MLGMKVSKGDWVGYCHAGDGQGEFMWAFDNNDQPEKQVDVNFRLKEEGLIYNIRVSAGKEYYGISDQFVIVDWDRFFERDEINGVFFKLDGPILENALEAVKARARKYQILSEDALSLVDTWGDVRRVSDMISRKRGRL